jgi:CRP/FNR family cyclic AMP-dependent transcriptional regulator
MSAQVEMLAGLPFLDQLPQDELLRIAPFVRKLSLSPDQVAVLEGEPCRAVYFPVRGLLCAKRVSLLGREQVLAYIGPGGCFNLVPALDGGQNMATVYAVTASLVYAVPCDELRRMVAEHGEIALAVSEHLAAEVRRLSDMVESLALHTVRARLARFLLDSVDGGTTGYRWTQEAIAAEIGTVREMVGRSLRAFADAGWVRRERRRLLVLDREALEREAGTTS